MIRRTLQLAGLGAVLVGLLACAPKPPANAAVTPNAVSENAVSEAAVSEAAGPAVEKASLLVPHPVLGHIDPVLEALGEQRCETLFQRFDANMKAALPPEKLKVVCRQILEGTGAIERVELVSLDERRGRFEVKAANGAQRLTLTVGDNAAIAGLMMKPAPPPPPPVRSVTGLSLPVEAPADGAWHVMWGGASRPDNHHADNPQQRRAADLVVKGKDGKTHRGEGARNQDYLCYGLPVRAVADGKVVTVVRGVPDNAPGEMDRYLVTGNLVVIDHGDDVFGVYAHLAPGSIEVAAGDDVEGGQRLAKVGNTGRSSEPHLHFHLQSSATLSSGWGVEAVFDGVETRGDESWVAAAAYRLQRGDVIRSASP